MGIEEHLSYEEYASRPGIRGDYLCKRDTWEATRYHIDHPPEDTAAFELGRVVHVGVLEPERLQRDFHFVEDYSRATKEGKARAAKDMEDAAGRTLVRGFEALAMVASVRAHKEAARLLTGAPEVSVFWTMAGQACKGRPDLWRETEREIVELKTCQSAAPKAFTRDVVRYHYAQKLAWYRLGIETAGYPVRYVTIIAVEKRPPYTVAVYRLGARTLAKAEEHMDAALSEYLDCVRADYWPGYAEVLDLELPPWAWGEESETLDF